MTPSAKCKQREIEQFEKLFGPYPGAPEGEPTPEDEKTIKAAIKRHREALRQRHL